VLEQGLATVEANQPDNMQFYRVRLADGLKWECKDGHVQIVSANPDEAPLYRYNVSLLKYTS